MKKNHKKAKRAPSSFSKRLFYKDLQKLTCCIVVHKINEWQFYSRFLTAAGFLIDQFGIRVQNIIRNYWLLVRLCSPAETGLSPTLQKGALPDCHPPVDYQGLFCWSRISIKGIKHLCLISILKTLAKTCKNMVKRKVLTLPKPATDRQNRSNALHHRYDTTQWWPTILPN